MKRELNSTQLENRNASIQHIFKLKPVLKDYIWGGERLKCEWGKEGEADRIAESWELSAFPQNESCVDNGAYKGYTISALGEKIPNIFGEKVRDLSCFPLLIKIIDACGDLSIQVHPDDDFALKIENQLGKSESWYIASASLGASIYLGFNREVTKDELRSAIENNNLCTLLNRIEVCEGDFFFVPAGTVHALLAGVTVVEIQESSSLTYRIYDYGRIDKNGNSRELHIEKALQVIDTKKLDVSQKTHEYIYENQNRLRKLASTRFFTVNEILVYGSYQIGKKDTFVTLTVVSGVGCIDNESIKKGDTILISADYFATVKGDGLLFIETNF
ncbi:MAG: class I mannose-6-phosphate isomerase [Christensenellaceae bacterium]|nr:class I mannose-6-phosphate isomerase [Christensenellaceae bacterium]